MLTAVGFKPATDLWLGLGLPVMRASTLTKCCLSGLMRAWLMSMALKNMAFPAKRLLFMQDSKVQQRQ